MKTLKSTYNVIFCQRDYGGKRTAISINRLADYIPKNRAEFILKKLPDIMTFPFAVKVQNKGVITIYLKG